jgi:hypothetical protein
VCVRKLVLIGLVAFAAGACANAAGGTAAPARTPVARLLFAGDVMLGRGVARTAAADPNTLLAGIRPQLSSADLTAANLESPLTKRPHLAARGPNALEADPSSARLLAAAGFDAMSIANNHAGDAGPATVSDTARALRAAGIVPLGTGMRVVDAGGLRVALLAFDATGAGPPGVARWDESRARVAVARARASADVVTVGVHGGAEYVTTADPYLTRIGRTLASWGVDVVWGQGAHVVQPIRLIDPDRDGRPTVLATGLGNLLFDQHAPGTRRGAVLEVTVGRDGVRAYRVGTAGHEQGPVQFLGWRLPQGDAVALGDAWWALARLIVPVRQTHLHRVAGFRGTVLDAALGDPNGDGRNDLVVAFRRPYSRTPVSVLFPRRHLVDARGRSAHVGLYRPSDLRPRWVAGTLLRPVNAVAPCTGALAVGYSTLGGSGVVATGAWRWGGFGFVPLPDLARPGHPGCADVDGDGRLDPVVLERTVQ